MSIPKLPEVNGARGAPMGRMGDTDIQGACYLRLMEMSPCGAYDEGGAYWGCGDRRTGWMYRAVCRETGEMAFVRAHSRKRAAEKLLEDHPEMTFIRSPS